VRSRCSSLFALKSIEFSDETIEKQSHYQATKQDLLKLYILFDFDSPADLQDKVFIDFMMYVCNRERDKLRIIKKTDFLVNEAEDFIEHRDQKSYG